MNPGKILCAFFILFSFILKAQVLPAWSTPVSSYVSGSCTHDGGIFVIGYLPNTVNNCSSTYTYSVLLSENGVINWEQAYDTTDCEIEGAYACVSLGRNSECFAVSTTNSSTLDTGRILIYNSTGLLLSDSIWEWTNSGGSNTPVPGSMGDAYGYYAESSSLFKADSLGHVTWTWQCNDSVSRVNVLFDSIRKVILLSQVDIRNLQDHASQFTGLDTAGNVLFDVHADFYASQYESPLAGWVSPDNKIYGFVKDLNQHFSAFGLDMAGNILWQLNTPGYLNSTYDSVANVLHYTSWVTNQIKKCYKINCLTGQLQDSMTIDSCAVNYPLLQTDKYGNLFLCYLVSGSPVITHRVEQYKPDYTWNWTGQYQSSQSQFIMDFFVNDSGSVFLVSDQLAGTMISKFDPPVLNSIHEYSGNLQLGVWPNPASDILQFTLHSNQTGKLNYCIMNLTGQLISTGIVQNNQTNQIGIGTLAPSVYLLLVKDENGNTLGTQKFMKY